MMRMSFIELVSLMGQCSLSNGLSDFLSPLIRAQAGTNNRGKNHAVAVRKLRSQQRDRKILVKQNVHMAACRLKLRHVLLGLQVGIHRSSPEGRTACLVV